jgi:hypothetical protein
LAEIGADLGDLLLVLDLLRHLLELDSTTAATAFSMPRLSATGLAPAVTFLRPSSKMASASTVAVVVPSPATSLVLLATSFTSCAPMFSYFLELDLLGDGDAVLGDGRASRRTSRG